LSYQSLAICNIITSHCIKCLQTVFYHREPHVLQLLVVLSREAKRSLNRRDECCPWEGSFELRVGLAFPGVSLLLDRFPWPKWSKQLGD
jgi:hypothetical protein